MKYGISSLSVVPVRSSAVVTSEIYTQLLFGELVEILDKKGKHWLKVRCQWDNAIGWIEANQLQSITPSEYQIYQNNFAYVLDLMQPLMSEEHFMPITIGAHLPSFDGLQSHIGESSYRFSGQAVFPTDIRPTPDVIQKLARKYLYAPYLHGGRSPFGVDSAGLVQVVYQMVGIRLGREPMQQVNEGEVIDFVTQAQHGDLAFFENRAGRVSHVGIILADSQIIHSYGRVRIDRLDHYGIFDEAAGKYTHKLRLIRRVLPPIPPEPKEERAADKIAYRQAELF